MNSGRRTTFAVLSLLLLIILGMYARVLFSHEIIRAPDIINEYFWGVKDVPGTPWLDLFKVLPGDADWSRYINSGETRQGGMQSMSFLAPRSIIYKLIPLPQSIAWFIVLHLFFGAVGCYLFARSRGVSRTAALFGGLVFALATENASLVNAGHVLKLATISFAPWAFYFLERGYQSRKPVWFAATGVMLALQFFNTHWQIAYYTCLALALYGVINSVGLLRDGEAPAAGRPVVRLLLLNLLVLVFFLGSVSISLIPLKSWSTETNRGAASGANQGKGGLEREEAMMWSMPPEELISLAVPGLFGLSRQEAGPNPDNIRAYYWGRMVFTQTQTYLGFLPWLLGALALVYRRDRITVAAAVLILVGILFSMGKYTPFYNLLFDYFPGVSRFRVPKMMMFVPVWALSVLSAIGFDLVWKGEVVERRGYRRLFGVTAGLAGVFVLGYAAARIAPGFWLERLMPAIAEPTRYQQGPELVLQRWNNLTVELALAGGMAAASACILAIPLRFPSRRTLACLLMVGLFLLDVGRVNAKFLFTVPAPHSERGGKTPVMEFLATRLGDYRLLPLDGSDPMQYASNKLAVMFTSNAVQQRRWQELLDIFDLSSSLPDMLNVKYVVMNSDEYEQQKGILPQRYAPVFRSPDGRQVVLENAAVLPKAWLVPTAVTVPDRRQRLAIMQNPQFDPRRVAIVEGAVPPGLSTDPNTPPVSGSATLKSLEDTRIVVTTTASAPTLLVLGEKYYDGWKALVDGAETAVLPVDHVLRGVYLAPGNHTVEFRFDPLPYKVAKRITLVTFALFGCLAVQAWRRREKTAPAGGE